MSPIADRSGLLDALADTATRAGAEIMAIYDAGFEVTHKKDDSPVTLADTAAEAIILADLARLAPGIPVVAEEEVAAGRRPELADVYFLVDPLDGTKEFINRRGDFTVNIALIEHGQPTLGVVYAPARALMYAGDVVRAVAWRAEVAPAADQAIVGKTIRVRRPDGPLAAVASASHGSAETDAYLARYDVSELVSIGSSLKLCLVAEGKADIYPRLAPTCEWDIAAGHAVLAAAGGRLLCAGNAPMPYGKTDFLNGSFVAIGDFDPIPLPA